MNHDIDDTWIEEMKSVHQPDHSVDGEAFSEQVHQRIRVRRHRRAALVACVALVVGALSLSQSGPPNQEPLVSEGTNDGQAPAVVASDESARVGDDALQQTDVVQLSQYELELLGHTDSFLELSDQEWAALDESLGEEYLAFSQMIEMTDIKESL